MASGAGADAVVMRIGSNEVISPQEFKQRCERIVQQHSGHEMHRQFDILSNLTLCSLGYSEGVDVFRDSVRDFHSGDA